jgi:hypothetical protein
MFAIVWVMTWFEFMSNEFSDSVALRLDHDNFHLKYGAAFKLPARAEDKVPKVGS